MDYYNYDLLKVNAEEETGFKCYESQPGDQQTWFGTSDKFADFKTIVGSLLPTGTVVYLIDTGDTYMYSRFKNAWYN